jgi:hypothetical protein
MIRTFGDRWMNQPCPQVPPGQGLKSEGNTVVCTFQFLTGSSLPSRSASTAEAKKRRRWHGAIYSAFLNLFVPQIQALGDGQVPWVICLSQVSKHSAPVTDQLQ